MTSRGQKILLTMINASLKAGAEILKVKSGDFSIREKDDNSPVTDADYAAQNTIADMLTPLGIPMISEESSAEDYPLRKDWREVFIIDPLDGTKEFINGSPQYGVNIALVRDGAPVAGVIFLPENNRLYFGSEEFPVACATCTPQDGFSSLEEIEYKSLPLWDTPDRYILLVSKSRKTAEMEKYLEDFRRDNPQAEILPMASCVKYCTIAEGRANQYTRYGSVMEWDTAAGDALLRSQGLPLRSIRTGEPLVYNKEILYSTDFMVKRP